MTSIKGAVAQAPASMAPKAYSYRRFSTPEQAKGDSLRRQTEAAQAWAERHSIALDTELDLTDCSPSAPLRQTEGLHERRISGSS